MLTEDPVDSRVMTAGIERWMGEDWLLSGTLYRRDERDLLLPSPEEGLIAGRSPIVRGRATSTGFEASARRLSGRVTGALGYSYGTSMAQVGHVRFRPPTDRRHLVDASAKLALTEAMRLTATYSFASGLRTRGFMMAAPMARAG
jgi:hypothetical protein